MKQWIRWKGLGAFGILVVVLSVFWFLIVDGCVERLIEKTGTRMAGAKVELREVDVTLIPIGMTMAGLQVTDRKEPMTNAIEVERIAFTVDSMNLLRRKVIIDEMSVEGVQFSTPRKKSGAVSRDRKKKSEKEKSLFSLPSFDVPSVKEILKKEKLESIDQIRAVKKDIREARKNWDRRIDELPDKKKITEYRKRAKKLRGSKRFRLENLSDTLSEVKDLKRDIKTDIDRVQQARRDFKTDLSATRKDVKKAQNAPFEEIRRIRDKYTLSAGGLKNMSSLLFGQTINTWVQRGFSLYEQVKPAVERSREKKGSAEVVKPLRGRGVNVRFREHEPLPDFLIRTVKASAMPRAGTFTGRIRDVTPDQDILGRPLTFDFSGKRLEDIQSVTIDGSLNHIRADNPNDRISVQVNKYHVRDVALSESDNLPVLLQSGFMDLTVRGRYVKKSISATIVADASAVRFGTGGKDVSKAFARAVSSALKNVRTFRLTADISGTPDDYSLRIRSDLDKVLRDAAGGLVKQKAARLEKQLTAEIMGTAAGPLKELGVSYNDLSAVGGTLDSKNEALERLLSDAIGTGGIKLPF